jgi:periplasmic protein TonB
MTVVTGRRRSFVRTILSVAVVAVALVSSAAAQSGQVYKVGKDGVKSPVLVSEVKPVYTKDAMDRKVQGTVEMVAVVKADGTVDEDVRITRSLDPDLDQAAITAIRQWKFRPGTKDDKPVDVEVNIEMTFKVK